LPDGKLDKGFDPGEGLNSSITCILEDNEGKILIGGFFSEFNGFPIRRIARLNQDGTLDSSFDPVSGALISVNTIAIQSDGKILVGGNVNKPLVRLNPDGSLDHTFNLDPRYKSDVRKIIVQKNGNILVGGQYFGGMDLPIIGLARLNYDGSLDESFNPYVQLKSASIQGFEVQEDGKILAFGEFQLNDGSRNFRLARFNQDGAIDSSFNPDSKINALRITTLAIQPDGRVLVGAVNSTTLYRINSNGEIDSTFGPVKVGVSYRWVFSVLLQKDNKILLAGDFKEVNDIIRIRIARLLNDIEETCKIEVKVNNEYILILDKNGKARLTTAMVDLGSGSTCGPVKLEIDKCDFTCADIGKQLVKFSVTDNKGNTQSKTINVTIKDESKPTVGIGQQSFVWIMQSGDTFTLPDFRPFIGAADNCSFDIQQTPVAGTQFKKPTNTTICFDVMDPSGNKITVHIGFTLVVFEKFNLNIRDRLSNEVKPGIISIPWNTSLEQAIRQGVRFEEGNNLEIAKKIIWRSSNYNQFAPGDHSLNATYENTFAKELNPSINFILRVENKPLAEDITINNNTVPRNVRQNEIIGKLETIDRVDQIHSYSMEPHPDFSLVKDVLVWQGAGIPDFETKLLIHSLDRAGQTISREIILQRKLSVINEVLIYPNPTFGKLNIEIKLLEMTNIWMSIYDSQGKLIWEQYLEDKYSFIQQIDWSGYPSGMYLLHVYDGISEKSCRFIKN
jgi:uncharacterized delta-60 repeat protein